MQIIQNLFYIDKVNINRDKMQRFDHFTNKLDINRVLKQELQTPLPIIQKKKYSICENELKYISKSKKNSLNKYSAQPRSSKDIDIFMAKDQPSLFGKNKKKSIKLKIKQKIYETIQQQEIKRLSKNQTILNTGPNSSVHYKYIDPDQKANNFRIYAENPSSRANMYQPYRKKSNTNTGKNQLQPITSEQKIKKADSYFFNIQKIVLLDSSKKPKSLMIEEAFEEREKSQFQRMGPHSKLIKQISIIKQKGIIKKIFSLNDTDESPTYQQKSISINTFPIQYEFNLKNMANNKQQSQNQIISNQITQNPREQRSTQLQLATTSPSKVRTKVKIHLSHKKYKKNFILPFQTYYYRDLLWKVNYTNKLYVEVPLEYEHRLKVFVGKGNNSCMVAGLIARRPWYAFTDKSQEANFAWTQLKLLNYYKKQQNYQQDLEKEQNEQIQQPYIEHSILLQTDKKKYQKYWNNCFGSEQHADEKFLPRARYFKYKKTIKVDEIKDTKMQNHLINNYIIGNKKALFNTMSSYYKHINQEVFQYLPLTFHIKNGLEDKTYFQFIKYYHKKNKQISRRNQEKGAEKQYNTWIVKPGQNSNRGNGIKMCLKLQQIKEVLKKRQIYNDGSYRTYIVQAYIQKPLLYFKRKFDLRHYIMITCVNGLIKGYWYKDGYVRTTSSQYNLNDSEGGIHLTNDAVQKFLPDYGKFQKGNKISYDELHNYIEKYYKKKGISFYDKIYPKMKKIGTDAIKACSGGIDPAKLQNNFQIFGIDFMIDANLDAWLIQINTNPCLQLSCPLLASLIPKMVENALQLTLDTMFPPPVRYSPKGVHYFKELQKQNKFQLVFDERVQQLYTGSLSILDNKLLEEQDDVFEDCGEECDWND